MSRLTLLVLLTTLSVSAWAAVPEPALRVTFDSPQIVQVGANRAAPLALSPDLLVPGKTGQGLRLQPDATNLLPPEMADPDEALLKQLVLDGAAAQISAGPAVAGKTSLRLVFDRAGASCAFPLLSLADPPASLTQSSSFVFSAWVRSLGGPGRVSLALRAKGLNKANEETVATPTQTFDLPADQWQRIALVVDLPKDVVKQEITVQIENTAPVESTVLLDALQLERAKAYPQYHSTPTDWLPGGASRQVAIPSFRIGGLPIPVAEGSFALWVRLDPVLADLTAGEVTWFAIGNGWTRGWEFSSSNATAGAAGVRFRSILPQLADSQFHLLTLTWDQEKVAAYLDAELLAEAQLTAPPLSPDQLISALCVLGSHQPRRRTCFGTVDDLRMFDRALTAEQVAELIQAPEPPAPPFRLFLPLRDTFTRDEHEASLNLELLNAPKAADLSVSASGLPLPDKPRIVSEGDRTLVSVPLAPHQLLAGEHVLRLRVNSPRGAIETEQPLSIAAARPPSDYGLMIWASPTDSATLQWYQETGVRIVDTKEIYPAMLNHLGRLGFTVSAHYDNYRTQPHPASLENWAAVRAHAEATAENLAPFPWAKFCLLNTEVSGTDEVAQSPWAMKLLKADLGLDEPLFPPNPGVLSNLYARVKLDLKQYAETGVVPADLPELRYLRWLSTTGNGAPMVNGQIAAILRKARPGLQVMGEPSHAGNYTYGYTAGRDVHGSWCYSWTLPPIQTRFDFPRTVSRWFKGAGYPILGYIYVSQAKIKQPDDTEVALTLSADAARARLWLCLAQQAPFLNIWEYDLRNRKGIQVQPGLYETTAEVLADLNRLGPLCGDLPWQQPRLAVLGSFTTLAGLGAERWWHWYGGVPYRALTDLHTANVPLDLVFEQDLSAGALDRYQTLVLPAVRYLPSDVYAAIQDWSKRGGLVVMDNETNSAYQFQNSQRVEFVGPNQGMAPTFTDALLQWAQKYRATEPSLYADAPGQPVMTFVKESGPIRYVFVINNKWTGGVGESVGLFDQGIAQEVTLRLRESRPVVVYDLLARDRVQTATADGAVTFPCALGPGEGRVYAVCPSASAPARLTITPPASVTRGTLGTVRLVLADAQGAALAGRSAVEIEVRDAQGNRHDESAVYPVENGQLALELRPALDDPPGDWTLTATDLLSNLRAETTVNVK